jgi:hypothetical protein
VRRSQLLKDLKPFFLRWLTQSAEAGLTVGEGPGIDVVGATVGLGGDTVLLYDAGGDPVREYAADATGLAAALAAAASGDIVEIPAGTITANPTIGAGVTLRGRGWASIINGYVLGGVNSKLDNCKVYQSVNTSSDIVGVIGPDAAGTFYVRDVFIELIQAGAGKALGALARGGAGAYLELQGGWRIRVNGGTGSRWAYDASDGSAVILNHGNVKGWIGA